MKRLLAVLFCILLLAGCGAQSANQSVYNIAVVPQAWSEQVDAEITACVKDRPHLNVYQNSSEEPDARYQALLVEDLAAQGTHAICLVPVDETVLPMVQAAREKGVIVIVGESIPAMIDQAERELSEN